MCETQVDYKSKQLRNRSLTLWRRVVIMTTNGQIAPTGNISSIFSSNSAAFASELLINIETIFPL